MLTIYIYQKHAKHANDLHISKTC